MMQTQDFYSAYPAAAPGNKPSAGRPQHLSSSAPPPGMMTSTAASMPQYSQQYAIPQQPMTHNAPMNSGMPMYQQWGYQQTAQINPTPQQNFGMMPVDPIKTQVGAQDIDRVVSSPSRSNNSSNNNGISRSNSASKLSTNHQVEQLQQQLQKEKVAKIALEAELKVKSEEASALKASNNAIVTAAVQLQPLLQTGYIMPETLQQFNFFVYQARMKIFEDQQREQQLEQQKDTEKEQATKKAAEEKKRAEEEAAKKAAEAKAAAEKAEAERKAAAAKKAEEEAKAAAEKARQEAAEKAHREAEAAKTASDNAITGLQAAPYDPHAPPIVFGGASRLDLVPESYLGDRPAFSVGDIENRMEQQASTTNNQQNQQTTQPPKKSNRGWETAPATTNTNTATKPVEKEPLQEVSVPPPKPTSWAAAVASRGNEDAQNVPPPAVNIVKPVSAPSAVTKPVKITTGKTDKRERRDSKTDKRERRGTREEGKGGKGKGRGERRERRSRDGKGGKGKGRHNNRYNKKQEPSAADLQAKADMEFARKLQAQINGTSFQGEWQCQSRKGSAKQSKVSQARQISAGGDIVP